MTRLPFLLRHPFRFKGVAAIFAIVLSAAPLSNASAQAALQTVGTLTIPGVADQPVPVYSAGITYTVPESSGGGAAPGAATFSAFTVTKLIDAVSPRLLVSAASGGIFPQARIDFYDPALVPLTSYELTNVRVVGAVVKSVQGAAPPGLIEEVSLDYERIKQTVFTPSGPVEGCWDKATNRAC